MTDRLQRRTAAPHCGRLSLLRPRSTAVVQLGAWIAFDGVSQAAIAPSGDGNGGRAP